MGPTCRPVDQPPNELPSNGERSQTGRSVELADERFTCAIREVVAGARTDLGPARHSLRTRPSTWTDPAAQRATDESSQPVREDSTDHRIGTEP
jgi:hypothetical protein